LAHQKRESKIMDSSCKHRQTFSLVEKHLLWLLIFNPHRCLSIMSCTCWYKVWEGGRGGQAKYAHPGQHTDIGVKSHEHTDYYHFRARITICFSDDPYHTISRGLL
jgi:hypothetical protein